MSKICKVIIEGYVIHKDGESHPDEWEWGDILAEMFTAEEFVEAPDLTVIDMVEESKE